LPGEEAELLEQVAGWDSEAARRYKLYLQRVGLADLPEDYDLRLSEILVGRFSKMRLLALDPYDLVLSKLTRNSPKDAEDVKFLAKSLALSAAVLEDRYRRELRPYLAKESWHDQTLRLWLEDYF
jgi:ABC-type histidine transport system ATPase subunit